MKPTYVAPLALALGGVGLASACSSGQPQTPALSIPYEEEEEEPEFSYADEASVLRWPPPALDLRGERSTPNSPLPLRGVIE